MARVSVLFFNPIASICKQVVNDSALLQMNSRSVNGYFLCFGALAGGNRNNNGNFNNIGNNGNWWSSTENSTTNAWNRNLNYDNDKANRNNNNKENGFSVRCLKDWKQLF